MKPLWIFILLALCLLIIIKYIPWINKQWKNIVSYLDKNNIIIYIGRIWWLILSIIFSSMIFVIVSGICTSTGSIGSSVSCSVGWSMIELLAERWYVIVLMSAFVLLAPIWIHISLTGGLSIMSYDIIKNNNHKMVLHYIGFGLNIIALLLIIINTIFTVRWLI